MESKKFRGRIYYPVDPADVQPRDVVLYIDQGMRVGQVESVAKASVFVHQPKGFSPPTRRVLQTAIKECWRWHRNKEENNAPTTA